MYMQRYSEIAGDDQTQARKRESDALNTVVTMLETTASSNDAAKFLEALDMMENLWSVFLDDLALSDNGLPEELRARLISIGLWIIKRSVAMRLNGDRDITSLVEINAAIRDGLR